MVGRLCDIIPNADDLLRLEPEELAGAVLEALQAEGSRLHLRNFLNRLFPDHSMSARDYPRERMDDIKQAVSEAWGWLESDGFLAPDPDYDTCRFITRRGRNHSTREKLATYRKAKALPWAIVHASIRDKVWSSFLRGDHDTAVFQAFKEVEVAVRTACGWGPEKIGVNLMRDAFKPHEGPLANTHRLEAEQIAERDLFAGAIGSYKNPQSHRHVGIPSAEAPTAIPTAG